MKQKAASSWRILSIGSFFGRLYVILLLLLNHHSFCLLSWSSLVSGFSIAPSCNKVHTSSTTTTWQSSPPSLSLNIRRIQNNVKSTRRQSFCLYHKPRRGPITTIEQLAQTATTTQQQQQEEKLESKNKKNDLLQQETMHNKSNDTISFDNFFQKTRATFTKCNVPPGRPPDHISKQSRGSMSFYWDMGDYLIRHSDHWSDQFGIQYIRDCWWTLQLDNDNDNGPITTATTATNHTLDDATIPIIDTSFYETGRPFLTGKCFYRDFDRNVPPRGRRRRKRWLEQRMQQEQQNNKPAP